MHGVLGRQRTCQRSHMMRVQPPPCVQTKCSVWRPFRPAHSWRKRNLRCASTSVGGCVPSETRVWNTWCLTRPLTIQALKVREPDARLPGSKEEIVEQAYRASLAAWKDGIKRQKLEILLPLIGATELDDWPGGIRQEFKAAQPMMEDLLRRLKQEDELQGSLSADIWDQGDAVGCWKSINLGLVLFLTGETLKKAKKAAEELNDGLLLLVNPQWKEGQLLSDLGIGPWKRQNEEFVASFQETYALKRLRISGDNVRLLKKYPGKWNIFLTSTEGKDQCLRLQETEPTYGELQRLLRDTPSSQSSKSLVERLQSEFAFNQDSLKQR